VAVHKYFFIFFRGPESKSNVGVEKAELQCKVQNWGSGALGQGFFVLSFEFLLAQRAEGRRQRALRLRSGQALRGDSPGRGFFLAEAEEIRLAGVGGLGLIGFVFVGSLSMVHCS
jgi:hypothetical protein